MLESSIENKLIGRVSSAPSFELANSFPSNPVVSSLLEKWGVRSDENAKELSSRLFPISLDGEKASGSGLGPSGSERGNKEDVSSSLLVADDRPGSPGPILDLSCSALWLKSFRPCQ